MTEQIYYLEFPGIWLTVDKNGKMYTWDIMNEKSEEFPPKSKTVEGDEEDK